MTLLNWIETYARTHLFYIILIVGGVFSFRVWLHEHDALVAANNTVKQQESVNSDLKKQIAAVQAQAVVDVSVVKQVVKKATTPIEVAKTLPSLTDIPLNPQPVTDPTKLLVEAQPLVELAGQAKESAIELQACQQVDALKDKQLETKDVEIKALKKKPHWYVRVKQVGEAVGIGVAIGFVLAKR